VFSTRGLIGSEEFEKPMLGLPTARCSTWAATAKNPAATCTAKICLGATQGILALLKLRKDLPMTIRGPECHAAVAGL